jgi:hypothetical protein
MDSSARWAVAIVAAVAIAAALVFMRGAPNRDIPGVSPSPAAIVVVSDGGPA